MKIRRVVREWHSIERMPTVPFSGEETADEKRETTGELTIVKIEAFAAPLSTKPEAIVRPLRRRDPSEDDNSKSNLQDLEAQIVNQLTKLDKPQKAQKESIRDIEKKEKPVNRWSHSRESKRSSRDVSDLEGTSCPFVICML